MNVQKGKFKAGDRVTVDSKSAPVTFVHRGTSAARLAGLNGSTAIFVNPESLAFGRDGLPRRTLYLVAFNQADVWGKSVGAKDKVLVDIYEHWLDPAA